jgi:hypothetical protein
LTRLLHIPPISPSLDIWASSWGSTNLLSSLTNLLPFHSHQRSRHHPHKLRHLEHWVLNLLTLWYLSREKRILDHKLYSTYGTMWLDIMKTSNLQCSHNLLMDLVQLHVILSWHFSHLKTHGTLSLHAVGMIRENVLPCQAWKSKQIWRFQA